MNPHFLDIVFRGHWEVSATDGEDNRRQIRDYMTSFAVRKRGRVVGPGDPWCLGSPRTTPWHDLAIPDGIGVDVPLNAADHISWANQQ